MCCPHLHVKQDGKKEIEIICYNTHVENSRLCMCVKKWDYMHDRVNAASCEGPFLPLFRSRHPACKPEHIWAKGCLNTCISRDKWKMFICSMPKSSDRGPTSVLQVMCVLYFLWQIQISATVNKLVCVDLEGRSMCCVHVGDKEHPWAGVSWSWNLYISQTAAAVNHLLKDFHRKKTQQPLKVWSGLTLCSSTPGHTSSLKCKFAESLTSYSSPWSLFDPCVFSNFKQ